MLDFKKTFHSRNGIHTIPVSYSDSALGFPQFFLFLHVSIFLQTDFLFSLPSSQVSATVKCGKSQFKMAK